MEQTKPTVNGLLIHDACYHIKNLFLPQIKLSQWSEWISWTHEMLGPLLDYGGITVNQGQVRKLAHSPICDD
jgi:hypothetical protein